MIDRTSTLDPADSDASIAQSNGDRPADPALEAALAGLGGRDGGSKAPSPGELRWRLTTLLFPSILLVFVAFYVATLAAGVEPELALFEAGGASLVLAVLARIAVGILGDETRLVLNDSQIVAMARNGAVRDYLASADAEQGTSSDSDETRQPTTAAQAAVTGGKE